MQPKDSLYHSMDPVCNIKGTTSYHKHTGTCKDPVCNTEGTFYHKHIDICMDPVCNIEGTSYHKHIDICMDHRCGMEGSSLYYTHSLAFLLIKHIRMITVNIIVALGRLMVFLCL